MRRWRFHLAMAVLCGVGACTPPKRPGNGSSVVKPGAISSAAVTQPAVISHDPLTAASPRGAVAPATTAAAKAPTVQPAPPPAATQPGPIDDRVAYAIGFSAGRRIRDRLSEDGRTASDLQIIKGVIDGLGDRDPAYPRAEVLDAFAEFQAYTQQRRAEKLYADNPSFRKHADENLQKSRALLDQNAEMAGVEVRPDGVQIHILNPGNGRVVGSAKTVTMKSLRVSLADATLIKSTTGDLTEKLPLNDALPALADAVRGMKVGSKVRVWLPPDKAYGLAGRSPVIGPNQSVQYEFEILNAE